MRCSYPEHQWYICCSYPEHLAYIRCSYPEHSYMCCDYPEHLKIAYAAAIHSIPYMCCSFSDCICKSADASQLPDLGLKVAHWLQGNYSKDWTRLALFLVYFLCSVAHRQVATQDCRHSAQCHALSRMQNRVATLMRHQPSCQ
jgi:hypothetical protein